MKLGDRIKGYEQVFRNQLMPKTPAIIRVDGKAFHTWTRHLERPFDSAFYSAMAQTAKQMVNSIQGAVCAYGYSDEISILLKDYSTYETSAWFDGFVQKISSVSSSLATGHFNKYASSLEIDNGLAFFDARVFSLPFHEVTNYFIWRQQDCIRNSIQTVARENLGHKKVQGLKRDKQLQALAELDPPVIWDDLPSTFRLGYFYIRGQDDILLTIPEFVECRDFIEVHVQL